MTRALLRKGRRGFTLVELLVYLSLVTVGLLLIGGVEMTAKRSVDMQQAMIDVQMQGDAFLGHLRRDVEEARRVAIDGEVLRLGLQDGTEVRWSTGVREVRRPGDAEPIREVFNTVRTFAPKVERTGARARVTVEVRLEAGRRGAEIVRRRFRTAVTRLEVLE